MAAGGAVHGLAAKVLYLKGRGSPVSHDLAAAARRVLDGSPQAGDVDAIRAYFNVGRSHAGEVRSGLSGVRKIAGTAMNVSRDYDLMQQGSSAAGARMAATIGLDLAQEVVKNRRSLIKIGEGVAQSVGADPALAARFFNSLSRIAKVGGVVGTAVVAGISAAHHFYETLRAGSEAGKQMNQAFFDLGNRYLAERLQGEARTQLERESFTAPRTGIKAVDSVMYNSMLPVLDEYLNARREKASAERMEQLMTLARQGREMVRPSSGAALAKYAGQKGKALSDLTQEEINSVLDEEAEKRITYTEAEKASYIAEKKKEQVWWERALMMTPQYEASAQNQWALELNERAKKRYAIRMEAVARAEQDLLRRMSPTDRLQLQQTRDTATANFAAYRSRHKTVLLD